MKTLKLFATLRDIVGAKEIQVPFEDGQNVRTLIGDIQKQCPELAEQIVDEDGELTGMVHILVHGRHIHWTDGLDTIIRERDVVVLMPPSAGG